MSTLLTINSSLFDQQGQSAQLVERFTEQWRARHPQGNVIQRNLAAAPVPHLDLERFQALITPADERSTEQAAIAAYSDNLIEELQRADAIALGVPMYNFSIPSVLRAYFDHVARSGITFRYTEQGSEGLLTGKKAYVFITRGGLYGEDHSQGGYVREFLAFIGITDLEFVIVDGLALGDSVRQQNLDSAEDRITRLLKA